MCLRRDSKRKIEHMSLDLISKVISEVKDKHLSTWDNPIGLCGIGEPTLHPHLQEAIEIIRQVPFGFGTNCEELTPEVTSMLIDSKFTDFNLSLDAFSPDTHSRIKPGLHYHKCFSNAQHFLESLIGKDFWRNLIIQFIVLDINFEEMRDFVFFWLSYIKNLPNSYVYVKTVCEWPAPMRHLSTIPLPRSPVR